MVCIECLSGRCAAFPLVPCVAQFVTGVFCDIYCDASTQQGGGGAPPPLDPSLVCVLSVYVLVCLRYLLNFGLWLTALGRGHRDTRPPTHKTRWGSACPGPNNEHTTRYTVTLELQPGDELTIEALLMPHTCACSLVHVTFHL